MPFLQCERHVSTKNEPGLAMKFDIPHRQNWSFVPCAPHISVHRIVLAGWGWGANLSGAFSVQTWGRTSSLWGWRSTGTGCPGGLWSLLLWRYSRPAWTRSSAACCRWPWFGRGDWTRWPPEVPSNPYHSVILEEYLSP